MYVEAIANTLAALGLHSTMVDYEVRTSDIEEDFHVLASSWPPLREFIAPTKRSKTGVGDGWRGRIIDWKDPWAVRELTKAQLYVRYAFIM